MTNLGFLPPELADCPLEISYCTPFAAAVAAYPALAGRRLLTDSDAHYLAEIGVARTTVRCERPGFDELALALAAREGRSVGDA